MSSRQASAGTGLGAGAVFLTAISTILGAILFLRFGYAVGNVGLLGTLAIIALGHLVTVPTAMAIAEIATNQRVAGGGAYHIISRSFGVVIGAAVGIALYLSQAVSIAFYSIAFAESFRPLFELLKSRWGIVIEDPRIVSLPTTVLLFLLIWWKGAALGVKALYVVVGVLFLSLLFFFLGHTDYDAGGTLDILTARKPEGDGFFLVFAIIFPAFTGVAAGLGLSGDLDDPKRAIPIGTIAATIVGMVIYVLVAIKLASSAAPHDVTDQFVMSRIAVWGPIIPIGLACATLSSAVGSMLVAPRTLQAIAQDDVWRAGAVDDWLRRQRGGEPINAMLITTVIALTFVALGDVDFVAQIISMFFMVTYGAICVASLLEHFAADPTYRPTFRSRWYISLLGALFCVWCMFEMSPMYASLAIVFMLAFYSLVSRANRGRRSLTYMFQGAIFQVSRKLQVFAQKSTFDTSSTWRPSVVAISRDSFTRLDEFELLKWIAHRYGFGTYIHHIEGYFSKATSEQAESDLSRLVARAEASRSNVYVDTIVTPSSTSLVAQLVQLPGISGKANNMLLFGYVRESGELRDLLDNYQLVVAGGFDVAVLATAPRGFGYMREVHVWLTPEEYEASSLLILLAYIIVGHPDWVDSTIRVFAVAGEEEREEEQERLAEMIREGRLPVSRENIEVVQRTPERSARELVNERSRDADLVLIGFRGELLKRKGTDVFDGYPELGNILFVNTTEGVDLDRPEELPEVVAAGEKAESTEEAPDPVSASRGG